jgi:hypothetical protein
MRGHVAGATVERAADARADEHLVALDHDVVGPESGRRR